MFAGNSATCTGSHAKSDLNIKHVDYEFISGWDFYLRAEKANTNNTAIKHLKNLGKIVRICVANKWITTDMFFGYKLKSKVVHLNYLTTQRLSQVRGFFLFSCYTGLSYVDVENLKPLGIGKGIDGERWIVAYRQKTDTGVAISCSRSLKRY